MKRLVFLVIFSCTLLTTFSEIKEFTIDKHEVKVGEKIAVSFLVESALEHDILKEDITFANPMELLSMKMDEVPKGVRVSMVIAAFTAGQYDDLTVTLPVANEKNGKVAVYATPKFSIHIKETLSKGELETYKAIKDPSKIELKQEKKNAKFRFYFEGFLMWGGIILLLAAALVLLYRLLMKKLKPGAPGKRTSRSTALSPFENFLFTIEHLVLQSDERKEMEYKVSLLSEALKELICGILKFNAVSETTRELLKSMREKNTDAQLISDTGSILNKLDMIKFAKASITKELFAEYLAAIKALGIAINNYYKNRDDRSDEYNKI